MLKKIIIGISIGVVAGMAHASADNYPSKSIHMTVGFAPGGSTDVVARVFGQKISDALGQAVVVENRAGAGGSIGADTVARSKPDGYRILMLPIGTFTYSLLNRNTPYNIRTDFTPISMVAGAPQVLVARPDLPVSNVQELIELAKSKPGGLSYASEGVGAASHLVASMFMRDAKVEFLHVPFKGAVASSVATAGGEVDINFPTVTSALSLLEAKKLKPLAVTSQRRSALLPSVPTLDEAGMKGFDWTAWFGFVGPAGMDKEVVAKLQKAIADAAQQTDVQQSMAKQGLEVQVTTPDEFGVFLNKFAADIDQLAKDGGIDMQ